MSRTHEAGEHAEQESTKRKKGLGTRDLAHSRVLVSNAYKILDKEGGKEKGRRLREEGRKRERKVEREREEGEKKGREGGGRKGRRGREREK